MMQTYQEEGESSVHIHFQVSIVAQSIPTAKSLFFDIVSKIYFPYCCSFGSTNLVPEAAVQANPDWVNCPDNGFPWREER